MTEEHTINDNNLSWSIHLVAISLFIIIFYIGNYHVELSEIAKHWWADMAWTLAALATGIRCIITARKFDRHYRKAWNYIGYACLSWFIGMLVWDYQELILHNSIPFPGLSDIGFILFAPFLMIGLIYYRSQTPSVTLTIKQVSELGIILCAIIISLIIILFEPIIELNESRLYLTTALAYPVLYMGVFFFGFMHPFIKPKKDENAVIILLLTGIGIHAFTDTIYAYSLLGKSYDVGHFLDVLWLIGFGFIYLSALMQSNRTVTQEASAKSRLYYDREFEALIPAIVIVWIGLLVFFFDKQITPHLTAYIFPIVIGMAVFMALLGWSTHRVQMKLHKDTLASQEKLKQAYNELDQRVIERTRELEIAKEEAEKASKAKTEFLSRMSHELRTPLNAVLGFTQLLDFDDENSLTPIQKDHVEEILIAGNHLLDLINEVLDLARIESGKFELNMQKVPVIPVIEECLRLVKPLMEKGNITLESKINNRNYVINADRVRLKQILINLLSNAIKFNKSPGTVCIQTEVMKNGKIRIGMHDTGTGIAEKDLENIFDPFSRFDKSNLEGTGIGLTVTKQLVEIMQGNIGVKSKVGQGSSFWLEFDLVAE